MKNNPLINAKCGTCESTGTIRSVSLYKFSSPVVFIGYVFAIPSIIGVILSAWVFLMALGGGAEGSGIAAGLMLFTGIGSMVGGLLGYLLIAKKQVLKCGNCGAIKAQQS